MTPEERIRPHIVATHRRLHGMVQLADVTTDIRQLFREAPDLLAYAQAEVRRLREPGRRGVLAETDHESKIRCQALERMIEIYARTS